MRNKEKIGGERLSPKKTEKVGIVTHLITTLKIDGRNQTKGTQIKKSNDTTHLSSKTGKQFIATFNWCFPKTHKDYRLFHKHSVKISLATSYSVVYYIHKSQNQNLNI